jgi:hypothetical protein
VQLAEWQARVRDFVAGSTDVERTLAPHLVGGARPLNRLAIHRRHYEASLLESLRTRFPATAWLVGDAMLIEAARRFIVEHPPTRPCMAEYGEAFPRFLSDLAGESASHVEDFAQIEWHVGLAALAVGSTTHVAVQWNVDVLFDAYLRDDVPDSFSLSPAPGVLAIAGDRGAFTITRLHAETHS